MSFIKGFDKARKDKKLSPDELRKQRILTGTAAGISAGGALYATRHEVGRIVREEEAMKYVKSAVTAARHTPMGMRSTEYKIFKESARAHLRKAIDHTSKRKKGLYAYGAGTVGMLALGALRDPHAERNKKLALKYSKKKN